MELKDYLHARREEVDRALDRFLPRATARPATIHKAMRYSLFAGGKRLRPILASPPPRPAAARSKPRCPLACAVECIHTYSLIHDDLPCMDDDDLRRGRPTSHKVFGEGIAVLAGDALLTVAFEILAQAEPDAALPDRRTHRANSAAPRAALAHRRPGADLEGEGQKITARAPEIHPSHQNRRAAHRLHPARRHERQRHRRRSSKP